jgi:hypothetical protein
LRRAIVRESAMLWGWLRLLMLLLIEVLGDG